MLCTKAEAAAIAYHAIHEQLSGFSPYEDKLLFVRDVIEIMRDMSEKEYAQHIDSLPNQKPREVE